MLSPEDRACLEWAYRVVIGYSAEDEVFVTREGQIAASRELAGLDPSRYPRDALVAAVAAVMQRHLAGLDLAELRRDLVAAGMGEKVAYRVEDHLRDVSVEEWARLRERIGWYRNDNAAPIFSETDLSGET